MRQSEMEWYQEEKEKYGSNGPVMVFDNYTGEWENTFDAYDAFRKRWPGAEITAHEMLNPGMGCMVFC